MVVTILVVEDHDTLRWSLHTWLEVVFPDCRIIEAADEPQATTMAATYMPEVIIVDTRFLEDRVFAPVKRLRSVVPSSSIIVMTDYDDDTHRAHALESGADAFVCKRAMLAQLQPLLTNMVQVARGLIVLKQERLKNSLNGNDPQGLES